MKKIKYSDADLANAVKSNISIAGAMRSLGYTRLDGGTHGWISKKIKRMGLDTSHFLGCAANSGVRHKGGSDKKRPEDVFVIRSFSREKYQILKRAMLETGTEYKCNCCGNCGAWAGKSLTLEIDHINQNPLDNRRGNLQFLCPNCHSQTVGHNRKYAEVVKLENTSDLDSDAANNSMEVRPLSSAPNLKMR